MNYFRGKKTNNFIKIAVSALLLSWVISRVDWGEVWKILIEVNAFYLAFYVLLLVIGIVISAYKWMTIARRKSFQYPFWRFFHLYLAGMFVNNFLPSFIGGDTYKAYKLGRRNNHRSPAFSTVVFDRLTGFWATVLLACFFSFFYFTDKTRDGLWFLTMSAIMGLFVIDILFLFGPVRRFTRSLISYLPAKFSRSVIRLFDEVGLLNDGLAIRTVLLSILFALVGVGLANLVLFRAFGSDIDSLAFMSVVFLVSILSSVPISVNNIGLKESAYVAFFGSLGVAPEVALAVALVGRFIQMIVSFFALPGFLRERGSESSSERSEGTCDSEG